jgi:hypothetical protein
MSPRQGAAAESTLYDMPDDPRLNILLESVVNGTMLDCSPATLLSLEQVQELGEEKVVEAATIRGILAGTILPGPTLAAHGASSLPPAASVASPPPLDPKGIRIRGAWIRGDLDLDGIDTKIGLRLIECRLDTVTMRDANLRWLELDTCVLLAAAADRAQIGTLAMQECLLTGKCRDGGMRLVSTRVAGELRISGTRVENEAGPAVVATGLSVGADALMDGLSLVGTSASRGALCLDGASITGQLTLRGTSIANSAGPALMADLLNVQGDVLLTRDSATKPFRATGTAELGAVRLRGATVGGQLSLEEAQITSCTPTAVPADEGNEPGTTAKAGPAGAVAGGSLARSEGAVCITGATISGDLVLCGATLNNDNGPALMADYLTVKGDAFRCEEPGQGFTATGTGDLGAVCLGGATITGQLTLRGTNLVNSTGPALMADSITIQGAAFLDQGFTATGAGRLGAVRLTEAKVSGMLALSGAKLENGTGPALMADLLTAQRDVLMTTIAGQHFRACGTGRRGTVRLRGAIISGQLVLDDACITSSTLPAAPADRAGQGGAFVPVGSSAARSAGALCITGAMIGADLSLCGAILDNADGPALMADSSTIQGGVLLDESFSATGTAKEQAAVHFVDASIAKELICSGKAVNKLPENGQEECLPLALSLALAKVGTLVLSPEFARNATGRSPGRMDLDGLAYTGLPRLPRDQEHQNKKKPEIEWISCLGTERTAAYAAQPYQQLAAAYEAAGNHDAARRVLIAQRDDARDRGRLSRLSKVGQTALKLLIGYGYHSTRALYWLAGVFALAALAAVLWLGPSKLIVSVPAATAAQPAPAAVECTAAGQVSYAIEIALPIVSLSGSSEEHCDVPASGSESWLVVAGWIVRALAATLAAFYLAGLAGLTRNS